MNSDTFISMLSPIEYKKIGTSYLIPCPFHDDHNPSCHIYPTLERGFHCFVCGEGGSWAWLMSKVLNIPYKESLEKLGNPVCLPKTERVERYEICVEPTWVEEFQKKYDKCLPLPDVAKAWLKEKCILNTAEQDGWRWHTPGLAFKNWQAGIIIPYRENGRVVYVRFRRFNGHSFDKPIGPKDVPTRPKFPNDRSDTVFVCEGETDWASLTSMHQCAICVPGAAARKCVNTAVRWCDINNVKTIYACGDNDKAGQGLNRLIKDAVHAFTSIEYRTMQVDSDINDDYVAELKQRETRRRWVANVQQVFPGATLLTPQT